MAWECTVRMHRKVILMIWKVHIRFSINAHMIIGQTILRELRGIVWEEEWCPRWGTN